MDTIKQTKLHKAFSVYVAFALALLMVPIVPGSTQKAAADADAGWVIAATANADNTLPSQLLFDQYGGADANPAAPVELTDAAKAAITSDSSIFADPDIDITDAPASVKADAKGRMLSDAQKAAAPENGQGLATADFNADANKDVILKSAGESWVTANVNTQSAAMAKALEDNPGKTESDIHLDLGAAGELAISGGQAVASGVTASDAKLKTGTEISASGYEFDKAKELKLTAAAGAPGGSVAAAKTSDSAFTLQATALEPSSTAVTLTFDYQPEIASYQYSYAGTCDFTYTGITYTGWTYTQSFSYTVGDDPTEKTVTVAGSGGDAAYALPSAKTADDVEYSVSDATATPESPLEITDSAATSKDYSFQVGVADLFPQLDSSTDLDTMQFGETKAIDDPFAAAGFASDAAKTHVQSLLTNPMCASDYYTVAQNGMSLSVKAVKQTGEAAQSSDIVWTYGPEGNQLTVTHTISAIVAPKTIDLSDFAFPEDVSVFRLQGDIEQRVLDAVNAEVLKRANEVNEAAGLDAVSDSYFNKAELAGFDSAGTVAQEPEVAWTASDSGAYGNFAIVNAPATVTVSKMREVAWPDGELALTANITLSSADDATAKWIKEAPTATYAGHSVAYQAVTAPATADGYAASIQMDRGDGVHTVELFALADEGHEITRVTGVSYKLDTQAPVLLSAEYSTPKGGSTIGTGSTLFGKDTVRVDLGINDRPKGDASESHDALEATASGLKEQPKVKYTDTEAGGAERTASLTQSDVIYSFSLAGNEDVPTDSIKVYAVDNAGNEMNWLAATEAEQIPVNVLRLVADADAPQVDITWDNYDVRNSRYYDANRTMTITVTEKFFNYLKQYQGSQEFGSITGDDGTAVVLHPFDFDETSPNSNVWTYTYTFSADTNYTVSNMTVTDLVGHSGTASGDSFTIDKLSPTLDVVFDNNNASNGNYYNAPRTATITVNEHNFNEGMVHIETTAGAGNGPIVGSPQVSQWSSNGDVRTATVFFPGEGVYTLSVNGTDLALNPLPGYTASEFIIDTTTPQIQISGVSNTQAYRGSAQPGVTVQDTNVSETTTIELTKISYPMSAKDANPYSGSRVDAVTEITMGYGDAAQVVENDGVYTLTVNAVDKAGNTASQAVTWSVNRFGSTYVLSDATSDMLNNYLKSEKVSNVMVTEINPSGLDDSATAVELTHDTKNTTLKRGSDFNMTASDTSGWATYVYTVDKDNFDSDGSYRVLFHSRDKASNTSENTMKNKNATRTSTAEIAFAVDNTAPIVSFVDLDSDTLYDESTHTASVTIEDNLKLDSADVKIDGEKVLELDSAALSSSSTHSFDVPEAPGTHEVVVTAYDAAGNAETVAATNITVTTDPVKLWTNNTPLFAGTIVGGVVVIGAAVAFFALRGRRSSL